MGINDYNGIADLYDIYVPVTSDIDFFVSEVKKSAGEVLELMSGTGRVSIPLIASGVKLTCVDISSELNRILEIKLQESGLSADVIQMDVCSLELDKQFAMAIIPFSSFAHITDPDDQQKALQRIWQHLLPGGIFIFTLGNPEVRKGSIDGQLRLFRKYELSAAKGSLLLWIREVFNPEDPCIVEAMQFYEEYDSSGCLTKKRLLELRFRLTEKDDIEKLLDEIGFKVKAVYGNYDYSEFTDESPMIIWKLEKVSG